MRKSVRSIMGIALAATLLSPLARADTITVSFVPILNVPALNTVATQFSLEIQMVAGSSFEGTNSGAYDDMVAFTFSNTGSTTANIAEIYWSWTTPEVLDPTPPAPGGFYYDPSGEAWTLFPPNPSAPPNMQGAQAGYGTDASADQGNQSGISVGESSTFFMGLVSGADWEDLSSALYGNLINFGMHVRSIGTYNNDSAWFVSVAPTPPLDPDPVVPVPAAAGLGVLGFGMIAARRLKR